MKDVENETDFLET